MLWLFKHAGLHRNKGSILERDTKCDFLAGIHSLNTKVWNGSLSWTRTSDPMINSHLLYQLSYQGVSFNCAHYVYFALVGQAFSEFFYNSFTRLIHKWIVVFRWSFLWSLSARYIIILYVWIVRLIVCRGKSLHFVSCRLERSVGDRVG